MKILLPLSLMVPLSLWFSLKKVNAKGPLYWYIHLPLLPQCFTAHIMAYNRRSSFLTILSGHASESILPELKLRCWQGRLPSSWRVWERTHFFPFSDSRNHSNSLAHGLVPIPRMCGMIFALVPPPSCNDAVPVWGNTHSSSLTRLLHRQKDLGLDLPGGLLCHSAQWYIAVVSGPV